MGLRRKKKPDGEEPRLGRSHRPAFTASEPFRDTDFIVEAPTGVPLPLDRALRGRLGASWESVRRLIRTGKVRVDGAVVHDPTTHVATSAHVEIRMASPRPTASLAITRGDLIHIDAHVVVVRKPPGMSTVRHPSEPSTSEPLDEVVRTLLRKTTQGGTVGPLGVVQRLDKETSGLIVFCRTVDARENLRRQFRSHSIHRRYLALAHGRMTERTITSRLVEDRGDGLRGSTTNPKLGREAITHVRAIMRFLDATLLECALETGRTHQIRIHLSEAGHPIVGERVYVRQFDRPLVSAPRLMLHAAELGFSHPHDGRPMRFVEPLPDDMASVIGRLPRA